MSRGILVAWLIAVGIKGAVALLSAKVDLQGGGLKVSPRASGGLPTPRSLVGAGVVYTGLGVVAMYPPAAKVALLFAVGYDLALAGDLAAGNLKAPAAPQPPPKTAPGHGSDPGPGAPGNPSAPPPIKSPY